jgi:hypothetical protein
VVRTAERGDTLWTRTYGGRDDERAHDLLLTGDGGFVVAGETKSSGHGGLDMYVLRGNARGDTLWTRTIGGKKEDAARSVAASADGGFVVAGYTRSFGAGGGDMYLAGLNAAGAVRWTRTYGGAKWDAADGVLALPEGGFLLAGETASSGKGMLDGYLVKTKPVMPGAAAKP